MSSLPAVEVEDRDVGRESLDVNGEIMLRKDDTQTQDVPPGLPRGVLNTEPINLS